MLKKTWLTPKIFISALSFINIHPQIENMVIANYSAIGKTHFIIGKQIPFHYTNRLFTPTFQYKTEIQKVLFSPHDNIRDHFIQCINEEQESIRIAIFCFTDIKIAQALVQAAKRGIVIEVITDPLCLRERYNKIGILIAEGIVIFVYDQTLGNSKLPSIMHNKFVLFQKNKESRSLVWTGSYNFTRAANEANQENVILLDDSHVFKNFENQYTLLKEMSRSYRAPEIDREH